MTISRTTHRRLRATTAATAALALASLVLAPAASARPPKPHQWLSMRQGGTSCTGTECEHVFSHFDGTPQTFVVPEGVTTLAAELAGTSGGNADGGPGGALRTEIPVTPGETLTAYNSVYHDFEKDLHNGGSASYLYRGTGAGATLLAIAGGGGSGTYDHAGGAGGGWHEDPASQLVGEDGEGPGAGKGATTRAPGGVAGGARSATHPGQGPAGAPGVQGRGGTVEPYTWYFVDRGGLYSKTRDGAHGGHGYYGGGAGAFLQQDTWGSGAGGGSGYIATGLPLLEPSQTTWDASWGHGRMSLHWSLEAGEPPATDLKPGEVALLTPETVEPAADVTVQFTLWPVEDVPSSASGSVVVEDVSSGASQAVPAAFTKDAKGTLVATVTAPDAPGTYTLRVDIAASSTHGAVVGLCEARLEVRASEPQVEAPVDKDPAVEEPGSEEPAEPTGSDDLIEGGTLSGGTDGTRAVTRTGGTTTSGTAASGLLATTGAQVTSLSVLALALLGGGLLLRRAGALTPGRTRHAR